MEARASGAAPETREAPRTNITVLVSTLRLGFCVAQYLEYLQASIEPGRQKAKQRRPSQVQQPSQSLKLICCV